MQETNEFYLEHKDKTFQYPSLPESLNQMDGVGVCKWYIDQMLENKVGWINLDLSSVNDPGYQHLPWDFPGRIECDKILNQFKGKDTFLNLTDHYTIASESAPKTKSFWHKCVPSEKYNFIKYNFVKPGDTCGPLIDKEFNGEDAFDLIDDGVPIHIAMVRPGKDCKLVVENFGIVPMVEGSVFLLNPRLKYAYVNTSETTTAVTLIGSGRLGVQFQRFCDLIARSLHKQLRIQHDNRV